MQKCSSLDHFIIIFIQKHFAFIKIVVHYLWLCKNRIQQMLTDFEGGISKIEKLIVFSILSEEIVWGNWPVFFQRTGCKVLLATPISCASSLLLGLTILVHITRKYKIYKLMQILCRLLTESIQRSSSSTCCHLPIPTKHHGQLVHLTIYNVHTNAT